MNILVMGVDTVALAASAKRAGYDVFAADHFGDQDLKQNCRTVLSIVTQETGKSCGHFKSTFSSKALMILAKKLFVENRVDTALLTSGLEDNPQSLTDFNRVVPIIGNDPRTIRKIRDKTGFFHELTRIAIRHPETALAETVEEGLQAAKDIGYPVVAKPLSGFGGVGIRKVKSRKDLTSFFPKNVPSTQGILIQEFVPGLHASASFLCTHEKSILLTLNKQLLGIREMGQREPFGYCGNVVPVPESSKLLNACKDVVQKIGLHFRLVGSNGVDLVISEDGTPHVIEVNPRFQATLECVERVLRINLVEAHIKACIEGVLPSLRNERPTTSCVRLILYAHQRSIAPILSNLEEVRNIPLPRSIIEAGEPICSIIVEEKSENAALKKAEMLAHLVYDREITASTIC